MDISFKQLGGLCTLDFMQRVTRKVGKKNLLRKSIILIKSWMTYESSLLGSHAANMASTLSLFFCSTTFMMNSSLHMMFLGSFLTTLELKTESSTGNQRC